MASITINGNIVDPASNSSNNPLLDPSTTKFILVQTKDEFGRSDISALVDAEVEILEKIDTKTLFCFNSSKDVSTLRKAGSIAQIIGYDPTFKGPATKDVKAAGSVIQATIDLSLLKDIAALESVEAIEELQNATFGNDKTKVQVKLDAANESLTKQRKQSLLGAGETIAVADSGIDLSHVAFPRIRVSKSFVVGDDIAKEEVAEEDPNSHDAHVASTTLGSAAPHQGMAPMAKLVALRMTNALLLDAIEFPVANDLEKLFELTYNNGARVINNSWGRGNSDSVQAKYGDTDAGIVDKMVLAKKDLVSVYAAMNEGQTGMPLIGAWGAAKNIVTVGATVSTRPVVAGTTKFDPIVGAPNNPKANEIASFSNFGPTKEGRVGPDIVAPGSTICSARTSSPFAKDKLAQREFENGLPIAGEENKFIFASGTSMAAPVVAGCAAILREALRLYAKESEPLSALIKALLLNGAEPITGVDRNKQGFGKMDMEKSLRPIIGACTVCQGEMNLSNFKNNRDFTTGTVKLLPVNGFFNKMNVKATLVWTDKPGRLLQNRLSLKIDDTKNTNLVAQSDPTDENNALQVILKGMESEAEIKFTIVPELCISDVPWALVWDTSSDN